MLLKTARAKHVAPARKRSGTSAPADPSRSKRRRAAAARPTGLDGHWTFLTNHTHVLVLLSRNPFVVLREVARLVGITERAVQRIIADLESVGAIERERIGRQNHYRIRATHPLRHAVTSHCTVGELLAVLNEE